MVHYLLSNNILPLQDISWASLQSKLIKRSIRSRKHSFIKRISKPKSCSSYGTKHLQKHIRVLHTLTQALFASSLNYRLWPLHIKYVPYFLGHLQSLFNFPQPCRHLFLIPTPPRLFLCIDMDPLCGKSLCVADGWMGLDCPKWSDGWMGAMVYPVIGPPPDK